MQVQFYHKYSYTHSVESDVCRLRNKPSYLLVFMSEHILCGQIQWEPRRQNAGEGERLGRMEEICFLSAKISYLLLAVQSFQRFYLICVVGPTPSPRSHRACPFSHVNQSALGFHHAMQHTISPFHCVIVVGPNIYDSLYWP